MQEEIAREVTSKGIDPKEMLLEIRGLYDFKNSQVTSGGVLVDELNSNLSLKKDNNIYLGGETIDIDFKTWTVTITDKNGDVFVLDEPYMNLDDSYPLLTSELEFPYLVPEGQLFVMGDNRNRSADSRGSRIGLVDERRVLGRVICRISPIDKFGAVE